MSDADLRELYWQLIDAAELDQSAAGALLHTHPQLLEHREYLGETPLHYLCVERLQRGVEFLLATGASPNPTNFVGSSPLQEVVSIHGVSASYLEIARLLLEAGADPHHSSPALASAWELVQDSEDLDLVRLVRRFAIVE